jgi:hypothetical protein
MKNLLEDLSLLVLDSIFPSIENEWMVEEAKKRNERLKKFHREKKIKVVKKIINMNKELQIYEVLNFTDNLKLGLNLIIEELEKNAYFFEIETKCYRVDTYTIEISISKGKIKCGEYVLLNDDFSILKDHHRDLLKKYYIGTISIEYIITLIDKCIVFIKDEEKKEEENKRKEKERIKILNGRTEEQYKIDCLIEKINK